MFKKRFKHEVRASGEIRNRHLVLIVEERRRASSRTWPTSFSRSAERTRHGCLRGRGGLGQNALARGRRCRGSASSDLGGGYDSPPRRRGRVVRQRPAKPRTPVQIRSAPPRRAWRNPAEPPGRAARSEAASSVAPMLKSIEAPCVLASERPSHPGDERVPPNSPSDLPGQARADSRAHPRDLPRAA